jgi:ectoine hydroxylase-related dioxygenase (phytanoyl-CoA dioxygenase family)
MTATIASRKELEKYFNYHTLSAAEIALYHEQGYLVIPDLLTPEGLARMREECMAAWTEQKKDAPTNGTWLQSALLVNIHHASSIVRDYYFRGPLVGIASQLIGPNIKGATSQLTFKMRGNTKPFGWHQDNGYGQLLPANALTTLTALDDTDQSNGCLWLIPGSHKQGQIDVSDRLTPEAKKAGADLTVEVKDESGAIPIPSRAGGCLMFHCHTLHKSEGNFSTDRDRRVVFLRYADADAVETYNNNAPRLGRLVLGRTRFPEVEAFEADLD